MYLCISNPLFLSIHISAKNCPPIYHSSLCIYISISIICLCSLFIFPTLSPSSDIHFHLSTSLSLFLSTYLSTYLPTLFTYLPLPPSVHSHYISTYLSYLPLSLSTYLSLHLSISTIYLQPLHYLPTNLSTIYLPTSHNYEQYYFLKLPTTVSTRPNI